MHASHENACIKHIVEKLCMAIPVNHYNYKLYKIILTLKQSKYCFWAG